jgi:PIN domain nuclease of toxin-antitoxin system
VAIERAETVYVSAATIWEIEVKRAARRLEAPGDIVERGDASGYERLVITFEHASEAGRLPPLHGDPFDRMLIAQARAESLTLMTADADIRRYDVAVLDADRR